MAEEPKAAAMSLGPAELLEYQPNRYPFLMLDHVTEVMPGRFARGHKNLTNNEWFFPQHFPGAPNMPGALQLEALAQLLTVAITTLPGLAGEITHALEHSVKFRREILPGERLDLYVEVESWRRGICRGRGWASVDNEGACEAMMTITIPTIMKSFLPSSK